MNGPQHFTRAQDDLRRAIDFKPGSRAQRYYLAAAQVHATLAQAAAAALPGAPGGLGQTKAQYEAWVKVAGISDGSELR